MTKSRAAMSFIALLCMLVVPGTGCSSRQAYPDTWPTLTAGETGCRQFAGRYRDAEDHPQLVASSLTRLLFSGKFPQQPDSVTFAFPDARRVQIDIVSSVGEPSSVVLTSDQKQFACDDGVLVIKAGGQWGGQRQSAGVRLLKALRLPGAASRRRGGRPSISMDLKDPAQDRKFRPRRRPGRSYTFRFRAKFIDESNLATGTGIAPRLVQARRDRKPADWSRGVPGVLSRRRTCRLQV
jgi:hypothetical protein